METNRVNRGLALSGLLPKELVYRASIPGDTGGQGGDWRLPKRQPGTLSIGDMRGGAGDVDDALVVVHSTFFHPNGDTISVYVLEAKDGLYLSDLGNTFYAFNVQGVDCTDDVVDTLKSICVSTGIDLNGEVDHDKFYPHSMGRATTRDTFVADFLKMVQAIAKATTLEYGKKRDR